jgi:hypothetical protein
MRQETALQNVPSMLGQVDRQTRARLECGAVCEALVERLVRGSLPPDDAYWWTLIAIEEAVTMQGETPAEGHDVESVAA